MFEFDFDKVFEEIENKYLVYANRDMDEIKNKVINKEIGDIEALLRRVDITNKTNMKICKEVFIQYHKELMNYLK